MFKTKTDMKKIYMTPEMEIVEVKMNVQILNASNIGGTTNDPNDLLAPEVQEVLWLFDE